MLVYDAANVAITGTTSGVNSVYYQAGVCTIPVSLLCQISDIPHPTESSHAHSCIYFWKASVSTCAMCVIICIPAVQSPLAVSTNGGILLLLSCPPASAKLRAHYNSECRQMQAELQALCSLCKPFLLEYRVWSISM